VTITKPGDKSQSPVNIVNNYNVTSSSNWNIRELARLSHVSNSGGCQMTIGLQITDGTTTLDLNDGNYYELVEIDSALVRFQI